MSRFPQELTLERFLEAGAAGAGAPIVDVRSPSEYAHARVPGAHSIPLFDDGERHDVGLCYHERGRAEAIRLGLGIVAARLEQYLDAAERAAPGRALRLYCWRGGMRSASMAGFLAGLGFQVATLAGGYRSYRRETVARLEDRAFLDLDWRVVAGRTGSGKTALLAALADRGEQIVDLEGLANHRGSAFGLLGLGTQPSQEQFENAVFWALRALDRRRPVWVEDESRQIGSRHLSRALWERLQRAPTFVLEVPRERRVAHLVDIYGGIERSALLGAASRIQRRLGGERSAEAARAIAAGELDVAADLFLAYYDKTYDYALSKKTQAALRAIAVDGDDPWTAIAARLVASSD